MLFRSPTTPRSSVNTLEVHRFIRSQLEGRLAKGTSSDPAAARAVRILYGGSVKPDNVAALFFVGFFNLGAWGAVYPYTSELFPTRLRSTAFGMVEGVGKAAAIAGPYLFGYLLDTTGATVWSLTFVAAVMTAGALVTLLGRETRGAKLT